MRIAPAANLRAMVRELKSRLGARLALIRRQQGLSLDELARLSDLTKSYLSKIERGLSTPSIASAVKLARALDLGVAELLGEDEPADSICIDRNGKRPPFVASDTAHYRYEPVAAQRRFKQMEPFLMRPPHALPRRVALSEHEGEELIYVLAGRIEVLFPQRKIELAKGDSVYFDSRLAHRSRSTSTKLAEVLVVINRNAGGRLRRRIDAVT